MDCAKQPYLHPHRETAGTNEKETDEINKVNRSEGSYLQFLSFLHPHQLRVEGIVWASWAVSAGSVLS